MEQEIAWLLRDKYAGQKTSEFYLDVERLKSGEPLAYIVGWVPFLSVRIYLDSKPLIPRAETEYWVGKVISEYKEKRNFPLRVLDLCAGSGCIGIAILTEIPNAIVDFAELDERHHDTIRKNINENHIEEARYTIFGGNLFENITDTYDLILTNPPYIDAEQLIRIQKSVLDYEPAEALFGGKDGMGLIEVIIKEGQKYLNTGGMLYIEHEPEQATKILALEPEAESHEDQFGIIRFSTIKKIS